jgi:hypothetical protein
MTIPPRPGASMIDFANDATRTSSDHGPTCPSRYRLTERLDRSCHGASPGLCPRAPARRPWSPMGASRPDLATMGSTSTSG